MSRPQICTQATRGQGQARSILLFSGTEREIAQGLERTHLHHAHDVIAPWNGDIRIPDIGEVAGAPGVL